MAGVFALLGWSVEREEISGNKTTWPCCVTLETLLFGYEGKIETRFALVAYLSGAAYIDGTLRKRWKIISAPCHSILDFFFFGSLCLFSRISTGGIYFGE